jgi:hypothetical protein
MTILKRLRKQLSGQLSELDRRRRSTRNVAVVSYPKSGRTWLHFMLTSAGLKLLFIHAGAENSKANRLEDISGMPATWRDRRIIFLFRDPRDTVVSCFFQATKRLKPSQRFQGTIGEFIRDPRYGIAKIAGFNLLWLEASGAFRDYASVSYEDLHRNTAGELDRLIRFATGKPADPQTLEQAVAAGSFDNMRRVETSLGEKMDERLKLGGGNPDDPESLKTRKGKVGGWREYFDDADAAHIDRVLGDLNYWDRVDRLRASAAYLPPHCTSMRGHQ